MDMPRRRIGSLDVSVVGIGCNQLGPTADEAMSARIVRAALDADINFFDTADEYGPEGISEEFLGRALRGCRDEAVIATKFGHFTDGDPSRGGAGARWIAQAVEDSLRRLGTDRIDLYQQHFPDPLVEPHETLTALDRLVREGKIVHHGVCNLGPDEVQSRCEIARSEGLSAPVSAQNRYNLLRQETRSELVPTLKANDMALIPYFPLASGMLTGKYRRGEPLPVDSRFAHHLDAAQADRIIERDGPAIQRLQLWAAEQGRSVADLAIAWLAAQPIVASVIAGVTKPGQVAANARATDWTLSPEQIEHVALLVGGAAQR